MEKGYANSGKVVIEDVPLPETASRPTLLKKEENHSFKIILDKAGVCFMIFFYAL